MQQSRFQQMCHCACRACRLAGLLGRFIGPLHTRLGGGCWHCCADYGAGAREGAQRAASSYATILQGWLMAGCRPLQYGYGGLEGLLLVSAAWLGLPGGRGHPDDLSAQHFFQLRYLLIRGTCMVQK